MELAFLVTDGLAAALALPVFLVIVGLLLIMLEVYVPSAGIIGFCSALAFGAGIWLAFRAGEERGATWIGWSFLIAVVFLVPIALTVAFRTLPYTPLGKKLILDGRPQGESARRAGADFSHLAGTTGVALTDLRPYGNAQLGSERREVSTEGGYIPRGSALIVHRVEGNRIFVRPHTSAGESGNTTQG